MISVGKAIVVWDSGGVIVINYLEKGQTIYGQYYRRTRIATVGRINPDETQWKATSRRAAASYAHRAHLIVVKTTNCGFDVLIHVPNSPERSRNKKMFCRTFCQTAMKHLCMDIR